MTALGYAGLLPFYGCAIWVSGPGLPYASIASALFVTYGAAILAFLGGTLWGYAAKIPAPDKYQRLLISNLVVLFAVTAVVFASPPVAAGLLALGQLSLLLYERQQAQSLGWYLGLRTRLVLYVLPAHGIFIAGVAA